MKTGVDLKLSFTSQFHRLKGYDFIELGDFSFSQDLCNEAFINSFNSIAASGKYNIKCLQGP